MGQAQNDIGRLKRYLQDKFPHVIARGGCNTVDEIMKLLDITHAFSEQEVRIRQALSDNMMLNIIEEQSKYRIKHTWFWKRLRVLECKKGMTFRQCLKEEAGRRYEALEKMPIEDDIESKLDKLTGKDKK